MKFSICIDAVYNGRDFFEAVEELAVNGFRNIEFWTWWDKDIDRLAALKEKYGLNIVTFCTKFYSLVNVAERQPYLEAFEESCRVANRLGCKQIITKPGDSTGEPFEAQYEAMLETLKMALAIAEKYDIVLLLEPVNSTLEAPNTFLDNSTLGFRFVEELNHSHFLLLYDIYHMQIDEGDVLRRALPRVGKIGHFHSAGSRNRHELADGELNYNYIFEQIEQSGYSRYVGLEYFPAREPLLGLRRVIEERDCLTLERP